MDEQGAFSELMGGLKSNMAMAKNIKQNLGSSDDKVDIKALLEDYNKGIKGGGESAGTQEQPLKDSQVNQIDADF